MADRKPSLVERLFAEHGGALQAFLRRRIRSKADTPDLVQEVYVRMLQISDLQDSGVFATDDTEAFVAFLRSLKGVRVEVTATRIRVLQE